MPRAEQATISLATREALARLADRLTLVAAVSGRAAADARRLVGLDQLVYVGNHGVEILEGGVLSCSTPAEAADQVALALYEVGARLNLPCLGLEAKGPTASIHYRECANREAARRAILQALSETAAARELVIDEGRLVVNLLTPTAPNKGTAVVELCERYGLLGAIYIGDDRTDMDAFEALARWRQDGQRRALSIGVLNAEAPPHFADHADVTLASVRQVEAFLDRLARSGR